ncbi:hypothetical protein SLA2020_188600 [Shorea laevis]
MDLVENLHVVNDLIDMYSKSGDFDTARDLFGYNMWFHGNVIIGGYTQMSHYKEAFKTLSVNAMTKCRAYCGHFSLGKWIYAYTHKNFQDLNLLLCGQLPLI